MEFTEMQAQEAARSAGIDLEKERFDLKALTAGMNAELEHGTASPDTNITNDDPVMTAKLAAAHLRVSPFYFPLPVIIPLCLTGDDVDAVTWENLGEEVKLYLFDREGTE